MQYLSKEIEATAKPRKQADKSLIRTVYSCGIFQDYGSMTSGTKNEIQTKSDLI